MATRNKAKIVTVADVTWSPSGEKFDGFLLLGVALPAGYDSVYLEDGDRRHKVPLWTAVPIRDGEVNPDVRVWWSSSLVPVPCKYSAFWYDLTWKLLVSANPSLFTIEADPYTITPPTLTAPAAPTADPAPETVPAAGTQVTVGGLTLTTGVPTGTINGTNAAFTLPATPGAAGGLLLMKNGVVMEEGVGFLRTGATVTYQTGYIPISGDRHYAYVWI